MYLILLLVRTLLPKSVSSLSFLWCKTKYANLQLSVCVAVGRGKSFYFAFSYALAMALIGQKPRNVIPRLESDVILLKISTIRLEIIFPSHKTENCVVKTSYSGGSRSNFWRRCMMKQALDIDNLLKVFPWFMIGKRPFVTVWIVSFMRKLPLHYPLNKHIRCFPIISDHLRRIAWRMHA